MDVGGLRPCTINLSISSGSAIRREAREYIRNQDARHLARCIVPLETVPGLSSEQRPCVGRPASVGSSISAMQSRKRQDLP
jgi:hypothetical protein